VCAKLEEQAHGGPCVRSFYVLRCWLRSVMCSVYDVNDSGVMGGCNRVFETKKGKPRRLGAGGKGTQKGHKDSAMRTGRSRRRLPKPSCM